MSENDIPRIPSISDRGFIRVTGLLYLYCEPVDLEKGNVQESGKDFFIPTFVQEEDDFVGLSIDVFREKILKDNLKDKEYYLNIQQLLSMMKRFLDAELLGRKQTLYKKTNVNISGSGLAFPSDVAYHAGQVLRMSLFFPVAPHVCVNFLADIVRSEKAEIGYEVKAKYKDISEKTRQQILDFIDSCEKDSPSK